MKRKISAILAMILMIATLGGCASPSTGTSSGNGSAASTAAKKYKIAFIARAQSDSFAAWLANAVKEESKKYPNMTLEIFDGKQMMTKKTQ